MSEVLFTERLYHETKNSHKIVDKHPFVGLIRNNKVAGEMYVKFNKVCIYEIQKRIDKESNIMDKQLYEKLHRNINISEIENFKISQKIIDHCRSYPLESAYQFYLGLLFGGNMLKRMLPEHYDFLTYNDSKELIVEFKTYLCNNVSRLDQDNFISHVNVLYEMIDELFDTFCELLSN